MTVSPWAKGNQNEPACHEPRVAAAANRPFALLTYCVKLRPQLQDRPLTALMDRVLPEPAA